MPTDEQIENARLAGWNPDDGEPPDGWDAHTAPPPIDPALGHNGVPAPVPGDPDYVEGPVMGEHADEPVNESGNE